MPSPSILCIQIAGVRRWRRSARRRSDQARGKETNEKIVLTLFGRSRAAVSAVSGVTGRVQINVGRWLSTAGRQQRRCSGSGGGPAAVLGAGGAGELCWWLACFDGLWRCCGAVLRSATRVPEDRRGTNCERMTRTSESPVGAGRLPLAFVRGVAVSSSEARTLCVCVHVLRST